MRKVWSILLVILAVVVSNILLDIMAPHSEIIRIVILDILGIVISITMGGAIFLWAIYLFFSKKG